MSENMEWIKRCPRNGIYYFLRYNLEDQEAELFNSESGERFCVNVFIENGEKCVKVRNASGDETTLKLFKDFDWKKWIEELAKRRERKEREERNETSVLHERIAERLRAIEGYLRDAEEAVLKLPKGLDAAAVHYSIDRAFTALDDALDIVEGSSVCAENAHTPQFTAEEIENIFEHCAMAIAYNEASPNPLINPILRNIAAKCEAMLREAQG